MAANEPCSSCHETFHGKTSQTAGKTGRWILTVIQSKGRVAPGKKA